MIIICKFAQGGEAITEVDSELFSGNHSAVNHISPDCHPVTPTVNSTRMAHHYFTDFDNNCEPYHDVTDYREIPVDDCNEGNDRNPF
jgi:hypothetical protein